jgi:hypothetical protein
VIRIQALYITTLKSSMTIHETEPIMNKTFRLAKIFYGQAIAVINFNGFDVDKNLKYHNWVTYTIQQTERDEFSCRTSAEAGLGLGHRRTLAARGARPTAINSHVVYPGILFWSENLPLGGRD